MSLKNLTDADHVRFYEEFARIVERKMEDSDTEMFMTPVDQKVMEDLVEVKLDALMVVMQAVAEIHSEALRVLTLAAFLRGGAGDIDSAVRTVLRSAWFDGFAYHAYVRKQVSG